MFKFKKFDILQSNSVMKIGTDSVLLGAIADCNNCVNILDIGTGTGVIALMLAQKSNSNIDCIDINQDAIKLANENIYNSLWKDRFNVYHSSLQNFSPEKKYDLIISNPPYFTTHVIAPDKNRAIARHATELSLRDLAQNVFRLLSDNGVFYVIYPCEQANEFAKYAQSICLYANQVYEIFSNVNSQIPVRKVIKYSKTKQDNIKSIKITIEKEKRQDYTEQFRQLTKDYYLNF